jgi:hypothetical protein
LQAFCFCVATVVTFFFLDFVFILVWTITDTQLDSSLHRPDKDEAKQYDVFNLFYKTWANVAVGNFNPNWTMLLEHPMLRQDFGHPSASTPYIELVPKSQIHM